MVGLGRFELPTSPLSGVRSSHLSYRPGATPRVGTVRGSEWVRRAERLLTHLMPGTVLTLSYFENYSRTGLNVRTGYADPDHRAETHEKREFKRGSLPELQVRNSGWGT